MKTLIWIFPLLCTFNLYGQGVVSQNASSSNYYAQFGPAPSGPLSHKTNLMLGENHVQTVRVGGIQTNPPFYPSLHLNPSGGLVGVGTTTPGGRLGIFHNSTSTTPSLLITEEGQDQGRIQFRNSSSNRYYEIGAQPGAGADLFRSFTMRYYDGSTSKAFFRYDASKNLEMNTGENTITYINYSASDPNSNELRVGVVNGGQNVNIKDAMRIYGNSEGSYWDIKSTNRLTFGHWDGSTTGDKAYIDSDGEYHQISDRRLKADIKPLNNCLSTLLALRPTKYFFKSDQERTKKSIGFIAQEVNEVLPEAVHYDAERDVYSVGYKNFAVLSVGAIQEQEKQMQELKTKQVKQDAQIKAIQERIILLQNK